MTTAVGFAVALKQSLFIGLLPVPPHFTKPIAREARLRRMVDAGHNTNDHTIANRRLATGTRIIKYQAMAEKIIVYWRDIPAQVLVQKGRKKERRELPERFIQAVDAAAMKVGAKDSDAYLAEWRRGSPIACSDDLVTEADNAVAEIEKRYDREALIVLVQQGGRAEPE